MTALQSSPEWLLIGKIEAGDRSALSALYELTVDALYAVAYGVLGNQRGAEATVGSVFAQAWTGAATCDSDQVSVLQWLICLTVQTAASALISPCAGADGESIELVPVAQHVIGSRS
jgi:DNA-directed RNA polymerase specialized sigma24 family protein